MGQGLIPDTGATEADIAIEFTALMYITNLYEHMTIDWLSEMADDQIAKVFFKKSGQAATSEGAEKSVTMSKGVIKKLTGELVESASKIIYRLIEKMIGKKAAQAAAKVATKTAIKLGIKATEKATEAQVAAATGPVGWTVFAVTLAFDILNIVWDIMDENGFNIVFDQSMIDGFAESINESFTDMAKEMGMSDDYLKEEINFQPLLLLLSFDDNTGISVNEEWLDVYEEHIHYYMTQVKGHPENWEEQLQAINLEHQNEKSNLTKNEKKEEKKDNKIFLIAGVIIIITVILLLILINAK